MKTYKKEFTVAKWSEIKDEFTKQSSKANCDLIEALFVGLFYKRIEDSHYSTHIEILTDFMDYHKIDFINFSE